MMNLVNDPSSAVFGLAVGFAAGVWIRTGVDWGRQAYRKYREARELDRNGNGQPAA